MMHSRPQSSAQCSGFEGKNIAEVICQGLFSDLGQTARKPADCRRSIMRVIIVDYLGAEQRQSFCLLFVLRCKCVLALFLAMAQSADASRPFRFRKK